MSNKDNVKLVQFTGDNKAKINSILPAGTQAYSLNEPKPFEYSLVIDGEGTVGLLRLALLDWVIVKGGEVVTVSYSFMRVIGYEAFSKMGIDLSDGD